MRALATLLTAAALLLAACGSEPKPAVTESAPPTAPPKPPDQVRRLPQEGLKGTHIVASHLMGKSFMPGGVVAHYEKGTKKFDLFFADAKDATSAALLLPDWQKALADSKFVGAFGGYTGTDGGRPVFVFAKGKFVAGVAGLSQADADAEARVLANMLY